jgi:hypothetical protein
LILVAKYKLLYIWLDLKGGAMFLFEPHLLGGERQKPRARPAEISRQGNYRKANPSLSAILKAPFRGFFNGL